MKMYGISLVNPETGHVSYYTGKAGGDWLSPNKEEVLYGYSKTGAEYVGERLKRVDSSLKKELLAGYSVIPVENPNSMVFHDDALSESVTKCGIQHRVYLMNSMI